MTVRWEAVAGGLLTGIGRGINEELEYKRQLALQQAELEARARERAEERQFRAQEREADRQFEREKLSTQQQFQREMADREFAQRKELMEREYGMRDRLERSKASAKATEVVSGLTTEEKNLLQQFIDANTVRGLLDEEIDWEGVQRDLIEAGHTALAAKLPKGRKRDDEALRAQARKQAEEEAEGRKSFWRPRSSEFPETQGSEAEWINRRTEELLTGKSLVTSDVPTQSQGGMKGTRFNPYLPQTDEDFEKIPPGAFYRDPEDGLLYQKG